LCREPAPNVRAIGAGYLFIAMAIAVSTGSARPSAHAASLTAARTAAVARSLGGRGAPMPRLSPNSRNGAKLCNKTRTPTRSRLPERRRDPMAYRD
jgi:hypothetical protein